MPLIPSKTIPYSDSYKKQEDWDVPYPNKNGDKDETHPAKPSLELEALVDTIAGLIERMCNLHARQVPRSLVNKNELFVTDTQRATLLKREIIKRLEATL